MQKFDGISTSILELENEVQKTKGLVSKVKSTIIPRVKQFDALFLDTELFKILSASLSQIFAIYKPEVILSYKPEWQAVLQGILFCFTILQNKPSVGSQLLGLHYVNADSMSRENSSGVVPAELSVKQRALYGLFNVIGSWVWTRMRDYIAAQDWSTSEVTWKKRAAQITSKLQSIWQFATLVNFVMFLRQGQYRTLVERFLRMRLAYQSAASPSPLNFDMHNQDVIWDSLSRLAPLLLAIFPWAAISSASSYVWRRLTSRPTTQKETSITSESPTDTIKRQLRAGCPLCKASPPNMPYQASCGHCFCYVCLHSATMRRQDTDDSDADTDMVPVDFNCPTCNAPLRFSEARRLRTMF